MDREMRQLPEIIEHDIQAYPGDTILMRGSRIALVVKRVQNGLVLVTTTPWCVHCSDGLLRWRQDRWRCGSCKKSSGEESTMLSSTQMQEHLDQ